MDLNSQELSLDSVASYVSDLAKELSHDKCNSEVKTCGLGVHISLAIKEWRLRVHQNLVAT